MPSAASVVGNLLRAQAIAVLAGVGGLHVALAYGPLHQQPGGDLHQAGCQTHAFRGVGQGAGARQLLGILAAGAIEIGRGLFDELHALLEGPFEQFGTGEVEHHATLPGDLRAIAANFTHQLAPLGRHCARSPVGCNPRANRP